MYHAHGTPAWRNSISQFNLLLGFQVLTYFYKKFTLQFFHYKLYMDNTMLTTSKLMQNRQFFQLSFFFFLFLRELAFFFLYCYKKSANCQELSIAPKRLKLCATKHFFFPHYHYDGGFASNELLFYQISHERYYVIMLLSHQ